MEIEEQPDTNRPADELSKEERIEAYFTTEDEHLNNFVFALYRAESASPTFADIEDALSTYVVGLAMLNPQRPAFTLSSIKELLVDEGITLPQRIRLLSHFLQYAYHTEIKTDDGKTLNFDNVHGLLQDHLVGLQMKDRMDSFNNQFHQYSAYESESEQISTENVSDWDGLKLHLATLPDTTSKIAYLIEQKAEHIQKYGTVRKWEGPETPNFLQQCQTEITMLKDLAELEQTKAPKSPFKLSDKKGSKTNLIRVLNAMYELDLIKLENGYMPTKEQFMQHIGNFLGVDMNSYAKDLEQALNQSLETNVKVFDELKAKNTAQVLAKQNSSRK